MMLIVPDWKLEGYIIFDIIDNVGGCSGWYPESLMKFCHDFADWSHLGIG